MAIDENTLVYKRTAELPPPELTLTDNDGNVVDLSDPGWTFVMRVGRKAGKPAAYEKTTGLVGAAVAPNMAITWDPGELEDLVGTWLVEITATIGGLDRVFEGKLVVEKVVEPVV